MLHVQFDASQQRLLDEDSVRPLQHLGRATQSKFGASILATSIGAACKSEVATHLSHTLTHLAEGIR